MTQLIDPAIPADDAAHLLLVDDDRRIRALMSRYLTNEGYRVTTAEDAIDAERRLSSLFFDLIILDVMMPGENGFEPKELSLRIASILRRAAPQRETEPTVASVARFGDFCLDIERAELRKGDEVIRLTDRERVMMQLLARGMGAAISRESLAGDGANERTIDVQINRLRRKIERDPANPMFLQTARGAGYRLVVDR
jgi:two-component system phosphate regulon response regulator OmpR